jgi:hypothetical protein
MPRISALNEITNPTADDILAGVDDSAETTKYLKLGTLLKMVYPIGSLYMNRTDDTSPATLFGFGTWVRIQGKTIVAVDDSDPDFAEDTTGGQKVVQQHSHGVNDPGHAHGVYDPGHNHSSNGRNQNNGNDGGQRGITWGNRFENGGYNAINPAGTGIGIYGSGTGIWLANAGSGANNMNPYTTAYVWERTA